MEKIYMEENSNKKKKSKIDISVILSFVVAIFAIISLVACGISEISYAAPVDGANEGLTLYLKSVSGQPVQVVGYNSSGSDPFVVPLYYDSSTYKIENLLICIEHKKSTNNGTSYTYSKVLDDAGLAYLLSQSPATGTDYTGTSSEYVNAWVVQTAVWVYLNSDDNSQLEAADLAKIKEVTQIKVPTINYEMDLGENLYEEYISKLVTTAKSKTYEKKLAVTPESTSISYSEGAGAYQTALITVVGDDLQTYDITFNGIDGVYAVGTDGNKIDTTGVAAGTKFYVRIPKDKVTDTVQNLTVSVNGHFTYNGVAVYAPADDTLQQVVRLTPVTSEKSEGTEFQVVGTPNTGMTTAQTIYFIGLIVLLCGVGIIYANAKPVESKQ
jgi:hypothetical protein